MSWYHWDFSLLSLSLSWYVIYQIPWSQGGSKNVCLAAVFPIIAESGRGTFVLDVSLQGLKAGTSSEKSVTW